ncbi:MAG: hypothetical protein SGBAC_006180 [Bacillariaceae sp.]
MDSSRVTPNLPMSPKSSNVASSQQQQHQQHQQQQKEIGVLRPSNSNTSANSKSGVLSPITIGPSPIILKDPIIIDIDPKALQQPPIATGGTTTATSTATVASHTSREGLKKQVERRRMTLTVPERNFLDHLCVHGNEVEVQLAYERLGDEDLFFDWQTPRHLKASENQAPEDKDVFFGGNVGAGTGTGTGADRTSDSEPASNTSGNDTVPPAAPPLPLAMQRVVSVGSQRRAQILEDRKHSKSPLWQAHESGIAVTQAASKKSIFKRTSSAVSILSNGSAATPQMIRDSSRFSFASSTCTANSGGDGGGGEADPNTMDIFRRVSNKIRAASPLRKARYQRSKSLTTSNQLQQLSIPLPPPPRRFQQGQGVGQQRRASTSSRKSVTFSPRMTRRNSATAMLVVGGKHNNNNNNSNKKAALRRSNSDGISLNKLDQQSGSTATRPPSGRPPLGQRLESMSSIPSIHHASPLRSDSSMGSIPSIHHANALRSESISSGISSPRSQFSALRSQSIGSIPSIRHANALRSESVSSIPSIRHANALRSQSITSIPSIHHANAVRGESIGTVPSIHPANAIRGDTVGTVPSIHPANAIRGDTVGTVPSLHPANAIRGETISSIPSIHPANALRSESTATLPSIHPANAIRGETVSSIPSIHHANAVRSDSTASSAFISSNKYHLPGHNPHHQLQIVTDSDVVSGTFPTGLVDLEALDHSLMDDDDPLSPGSAQQHPSSVRKKILDHQNSILASTPSPPQLSDREQQLMPTYSATPDIASAWLNQQQGHFQSKPFDFQSQSSQISFPPAIQIPSTITDRTEQTTFSSKDASTAADDEAAFVVNQKAVLVRRASRNSQYDGEGMEVTEMSEREYEGEHEQPPYALMMGQSIMNGMGIRQCTSFDDETMSLYSHRQNNFDEVFRRSIRRTFSDEEVVAANMMVGSGPNATMVREISQMTISKREFEDDDDSDDDDASWDLQSRSGDTRYDSWNIVKDEYVNGYGGGGSLDFMILGTCADDLSASPHVLSPPMMESLAGFLPYAQSSENFFLRYSLVRDGASMLTFLKRSRGVKYGILALETVDGEVFGCFTGQPWRKNPNYFGTGESFLWKMRRSRLEETNDILEQAQLESEVDVYPHTGENQYYQLCTHDRIAMGGGTPTGERKTAQEPPISPHEWGYGLGIEGDLLVGSSNPCATFNSPSLSKVHADGSLFEIVNLELWALTPCTSVQEAERLELGKLFLERQ